MDGWMDESGGLRDPDSQDAGLWRLISPLGNVEPTKGSLMCQLCGGGTSSQPLIPEHHLHRSQNKSSGSCAVFSPERWHLPRETFRTSCRSGAEMFN